MTQTTRTPEVWLEIWKAQPSWSEQWMLQFIKDVQADAKKQLDQERLDNYLRSFA
jgi:hypothetical protein